MQNDQQISQSVDNLISQIPDDDDITTPSFSLGTNPSQQQPQSSPAIDDNAAPHNDAGQVIQPQTSDNMLTQNPSDDAIISPDNNQNSSNGDFTGNHSLSAGHTESADDDLQSIKEQALGQLSPIVSELDQPPEEKYRTLMMLIQASDDQSLIKEAYSEANKIEDKKLRAEALLNIVNEINYFSGKNNSDNLTN